ncbi:MAG: YDG domain-containing protein [Coriobacteriales bacterium]|nr:YDG domain-containing protein [Coriobacteriales bacterium]
MLFRRAAISFIFCAFLVPCFCLVSFLTSSNYAFGSDAPVSQTYTVVLHVGDSHAAGTIPLTGEGLSLLFVALAFFVTGILALVFSYKAKRHTSHKIRQSVLPGSLLALLLSLTAFLSFSPIAFGASSSPDVSLTIDKAMSLIATDSLVVNGQETQSRFVRIDVATRADTPDIQLSLAGTKLSKTTTPVSVIEDPLSDGLYPLDLQAVVDNSLASGDYLIDLKITITDLREDLTVIDTVVDNKTYDGATGATIQDVGRLLGNIAPGDTVTLDSSSAQAAFVDKDAGEDKLLVLSGFEITGPAAFKYVLSQPSGITASIAAMPLSFSGTLSAGKAYDGTVSAPPLSALTVSDPTSFSGLAPGEGFTLDSSAVIAIGGFSSPDLYPSNSSLDYTGTLGLTDATGGALASNYLFTPPTTLVGQIYDYIEISVTTDTADQTVCLNKYFANAFDVAWDDTDTSQDGPVTQTITHTYASAGTYTIRLISQTYARYQAWTFNLDSIPLISKYETSATNVAVSFMPPMERFQTSTTTVVPDNFFVSFNFSGALTSLPAGSFDISGITTVGDNFFDSFNTDGKLVSLPDNSFDTSNITGAVGENFFAAFNNTGELVSLPDDCFDIRGIAETGDYFFSYFNRIGALTSLPASSFDTGNITTVGDNFFSSFNRGGDLASLPDYSFDISGITEAGNYFFAYFNDNGALSSLPDGSFDTGNIAAAGDYFFVSFNNFGALTSLPDYSFDISGITAAGEGFFTSFNESGKLASLPDDSFNTGNITGAVGRFFFRFFNSNGALTSLPDDSFDTSNITDAGADSFSYFNNFGALTSLPDGSFNTGNITAAGNYFFACFNTSGDLTSLPDDSFDTSNITDAGEGFFTSFNESGKLASLPDDSFNTGNITAAGHYFFAYFNTNGDLASLPVGSFNTSNIITVGTYFFSSFNYSGKLGSVPYSFKFPPLDEDQASHDSNFAYSFSSSTSLDPDGPTASDIINYCAPPSSPRNTFSSNQPGYSDLNPNWQST